MYCRNCSNELSELAIACPKCGVPPLKGKNFCNYCGGETHPEAIICVKCGCSLKNPLKVNLVSIWSKYSYCNYILILLLSLLPFFNINVLRLTGLVIATGVEPPTVLKGNRYWRQTVDMLGGPTILDPKLIIFYMLIILCVIFLIPSIQREFKFVRSLSIVSLILLLYWGVGVYIGMRNFNDSLEFSFGIGFWLTVILHITSIILLSIYLKEKKALVIIPKKLMVEPESRNTILSNETNEGVNSDYVTKYEEIFPENKKNTKLKYIIGSIILMLVIAVIYFIVNKDSEPDLSTSNAIPPTTTAAPTTIPTETTTSQNIEKTQTPAPVDTGKTISMLSEQQKEESKTPIDSVAEIQKNMSLADHPENIDDYPYYIKNYC